MARGGKIAFKTELSCPKCGRKGSAEYEDIESPPHHSGVSGYEPAKLTGIEGEFKAVGSSIQCACGEKVA